MKSRTTTLVAMAAALAWCAGCAKNHVDVQQFGQMHEVLSGGAENAVAIVNLEDVLSRPNAVGVGALAGLKGEITICDGQAWVAQPSGRTLRVSGPSKNAPDEAAMLTVTYVAQWRDVPIDRALAGAALEDFIVAQAADAGLDASQPFPFEIEGAMTDLKIHVVNGECPMRPGVVLTAAQQPWRYSTNQPTQCTIVGFYAKDAVGRLTHPGTAIHAHALVEADGKKVTGHVERVAVDKGAVLRLPVPK